MKNKITNVNPRFCFVCGSKLEKIDSGFYQCENEKCGEVFISFKDQNNNQSITLITTPFTPKDNEQKL